MFLRYDANGSRHANGNGKIFTLTFTFGVDRTPLAGSALRVPWMAMGVAQAAIFGCRS